MKKAMNSKKRITSLVILLMLFVTVFSAIAVVGSAETEAIIEDGRAFTLEDDLSLIKDLESVPKTFEATIKVPTSQNRAGVIFGNYSSSDGSTLNFEIAAGGKPRLYMRDENGNLFDITFNVDIRRDTFVHVAITHSVLSDGNSEFTLYVDGVKSATVTNATACELDAELLQREVTLMLARDGRWRNEQYFKGNIRSLGLYFEPLTADEISGVYQSGIDANISSRIAYYDLTKESNNSGKYVSDSTGNGYDFASIFYFREESVGDYDYSFAIVGDTQCLVEHDNENEDSYYTNAIYDWLVKNKDSKKIKYVLGLGDVTQDNIDAEWEVAKAQISKLNGVLPYSLVTGNHDSVAQLDKYFAQNVNFDSQEIGYYSGTSLGNYYVKFTAGGNKYMIVALQFAPNNAMIEWANNVIGTNPEYSVIITTHAYLDGDGDVLVAGDGGSPSHYNKNNPNGDVMWEKLVSKNRNIKMIFSGHIAADNIVYRCDEGEEGNNVYQLLVNPQGMDHTYLYETGMVAMLYFSNGGNTVKVEYISAFDSLKAQETDETAEDVLFGRKNQFTLNFEEKPVADKGEINVWLIGGQSNAVGYANDLTAYVGKDSRYINGFENVLYYGYGEQWVSNFVPTRVGLGQTNKKSGNEIGIASALGNTGEMHAIIKYAEGGTYLAPTSAAKGTWTSPSYITDNSISTDGNKIGYLYNSFIDTVESAIYELRAMGYTPVIQGMWWMQGCAESYDAYSEQYEALLCALIKDVRTDVEERTGVESSDMPFVFGKIIFNPNGEKIPSGYLEEGSYYNKVLEAQRNVANDETIKNVCMLDAKTGFASGFGQIDTWHYNAATQEYLGIEFVNAVNAFNGKCIVSGSGDNASIAGGGLYSAGDTVTVTFNALDGFSVNSVLMSVGGAAATSINLTDGKYTFTSDGQNVVFSIETVGGNEENTGYGTIPSEYPKSEYPFAIFMNGEFLVAKANWTSAVIAAHEQLRGSLGEGNEVVVLLRTDYTTSVLDVSSNYLTHFNGSFTLDLGENTFTRAEGYLFDIYASVTDNTLFTTNIILKNGTVVAKKAPLIGLNHSASSSLNGSLKHFDFEFENVTFAIARGTSIASGFITACWENGSYGMTADLTFIDCTFDFTNAIKDSVMINLAGDSKSLTKVKLDIAGGNIIAGKNAVVFVKTDAGDVVGLSKNSLGEYVTLTAPTGADVTAFTDAYVSSDLTKTLVFEVSSENQTEKKYSIKESSYVKPVETEYGTIPETHHSADAYPFVLFDMSKALAERFIGGYTDLGAAMTQIKSSYLNNKNANLVILMRKDGEKSTKADIAHFTGKLKIDLGGHKLNLTSGGNYVFDFFVNSTNNAGLRGTYTLVNGIIDRVSGTAIVNTNYNGKMSTSVNFKFNFENITFRSTAKSTHSLITFSWENNFTGVTDTNGSECITNYFTFTDCTLDFKNSAAGTVMLRLKSTSDADRMVCHVEFKGGKIVSDKAIGSLVEMNTTGTRADSFTFIADSNGNYTTLELSSGVEPISNTFNGDTMSFTKDSEANGVVIYKLTSVSGPVLPETTVYGDIPVAYISATTYPIALFKADKTFVGAYSDFGSATSAMLSTDVAGDYVILLRNNAIQNVKTSLYNFTGSLTVDLNGYTLEKQSQGYLVDVYYSKNSGTGTDVRGTYIFKNGPIKKIAGNALFCVNYAADLKRNGEVNFFFGDVKFYSTHTGTNVMFQTWENGYSTVKNGSLKIECNAEFDNCTFDYKSSHDNAIMFPSLYSSGNRTVFNITINGGKIIAKSEKSMNRFVDMNNDEGYSDSLVFGKDKNGNYTSLVLPTGVEAPLAITNMHAADSPIAIATASGISLTFVKTSADASTETYKLCETVKVGFAPKMSITLGNELVMNVYVPKNNLEAFTLGGIEYNVSDLAESIITLGDGNEYYLVSIPLGSSEAAGDVKLVATVTAAGNTAKATYTFSIIKYSTKLLANGTEVEKTLAKDVLNYIKEAYKYFTAHNEENEIARVTALIDEIIGDYTAEPTSVGTTESDSAGIVTNVTLNLDAKPTIRFYVTDTSVEFFANGRKLNTVIGTDETYGAYVELDVYAYALCEVITYGEGGSYHISDFIKGSLGTSHESLVKSFVKYTESAADYRNSVIGSNK
ncbi:MAG: hypothetical protein E7673_05635 [Ruminococcaceae bacterium]|nr:hypothetical protein [Oscillospiraceae bacterium]